MMVVMMMLVWFLFHKSSCSCESFCRVGTLSTLDVTLLASMVMSPVCHKGAVRFYLGQMT